MIINESHRCPRVITRMNHLAIACSVTKIKSPQYAFGVWGPSGRSPRALDEVKVVPRRQAPPANLRWQEQATA